MAEKSARSGVISAGMVIGLHNDIILPYFITYANEEQKRRWLPAMCSGELITAIAMTEPDTGSDLAAIRTTAERRGDYYILNRKKIEMSPDLQKLAEEDFCYLTTTGRISGRPHTIEIWFALHEQTIYLLSGGRDKSDWVKNALHTPTVRAKINSTILSGTARLITDTEEDTLARKIVFEKYVPRNSDDLVDWSRISLPITVDIMG